MYISYECNKCKTVFIMPTYDIERMERGGRYMTCPFGHRHIELLDKYDNLLECMNHRAYKRINGRIKQIK